MGFTPKFWARGGDLRRPFATMWMEIGWGLYFQVVGTHKHYMWSSKFFPPLVVETLKPSITFGLLPSLPAHSPCSQLTPLAPSLLPLLPACSPCSLCSQLTSLTPSSLPLLPPHSPHSQLAPLASSLLPLLPACSPCSQLTPLTPSLLPCSPCSQLAPGTKRCSVSKGASWK